MSSKMWTRKENSKPSANVNYNSRLTTTDKTSNSVSSLRKITFKTHENVFEYCGANNSGDSRRPKKSGDNFDAISLVTSGNIISTTKPSRTCVGQQSIVVAATAEEDDSIFVEANSLFKRSYLKKHLNADSKITSEDVGLTSIKRKSLSSESVLKDTVAHNKNGGTKNGSHLSVEGGVLRRHSTKDVTGNEATIQKAIPSTSRKSSTRRRTSFDINNCNTSRPHSSENPKSTDSINIPDCKNRASKCCCEKAVVTKVVTEIVKHTNDKETKTIYKQTETKYVPVLTGNSNTYLVVKQRLELPFIASKVRFIPYSEHPRTVCMRVELYGCPVEQYIVQYEAPRGDEQNAKVDLDDISYDGVLDGNFMRGGLGQLVDGLYGGDDYQKQLQGESSGSRWVGWRNDSLNGSPLEITFQFDTVREFTTIYLHTNNMFTRGVQVFSTAEVWFGLYNERYQEFPITKVLPPDQSNESARNISLQFPSKWAKFIKLRLFFADRWILLSEITLVSVPLQRNMTEDMMEKYYTQPDVVQSTPLPAKTGGEIIHARKELAPETSPTRTTQTYIGLITGSLAMVVLLLACTVLFMIKRGRKKVALLHKHTALVSSSTKPGITMNMKDLKMNMSTPIINNGLSRLSFNNKLGPTDTVNSKKSKMCNLYGHVNGEESDSENSSVYHEPYKLLPTSNSKFGCNPVSDLNAVNAFQEDLKFTSPSFYNLTPPSALVSSLPNNDVPSYQTPNLGPDQYYAAADIIKNERTEQHFTPGRFTSIKLPESAPVEGVAQLLEFPRHKLRLLEKLGEGDFGAIHLCEAESLPDYNGGTVFHKKNVIMKSLWKNSDEKKMNEFLKEISWLAGVRDPNIARVVGFCSQDEPMCALLEYSEFGELSRFLAQNSSNDDLQNQAISYGCLIFIATQIASGMKYLESLDLVHRDLSARNCVIDKKFNVKVSDHAMYCDRYNGDYYISDTKSKLPIRWMSWENLLLGKQTTKSDVWSFAITLWEILMFCLQQPYAELTNEQVIENSSHWYQNDGCQRYLSRPTICPREIYDLMGECWKRNASDRPRFAEIHLFLQRKNLGYLPASIC